MDLFSRIVQYGKERLKLINQEVDIAALTEENFWPIFADLHREPLLRSFEEPWLFAAIKAAGRLSPAVLEREPLATFAKQIITYVMTIVKRGQEIGVVRTDIPDKLIFAWLQALDDIGDMSLLAHPNHLYPEALAQFSAQ